MHEDAREHDRMSFALILLQSPPDTESRQARLDGIDLVKSQRVHWTCGCAP
jgi:hypothetical protein